MSLLHLKVELKYKIRLQKFIVIHGLTLCFFLFNLFCYSQKFSPPGKIDSLRQIINSTLTDSGKAIIYNALAYQFAFSSPDSADFYTNKSLVISQKYLSSADIDEQLKFLEINAASLHNYGVINYYNADYSKSLEYYFKALDIRDKLVKEHPAKLSYKNDLADTYNNIGIVYKGQANFEKALESYMKVLFIYESINKLNNGNFSSKSGLGAAYNNLGLLYHTIGKYSEALQYHFLSLKVKEEISDKPGIAYSFNNIGIVYDSQGNIELAMEYYLKSLELRKALGDKMGMAVSYNNIGNLYSDQGKFKQALEYLVLSVNLKEEAGDKKGIANSYSNIGTLYYELGIQQKKTDSAAAYYKNSLYYFNEVLNMDQANNDQNGMASSYLNIGSVFTQQSLFKEALDYLQQGLKISQEIEDKDLVKIAYLCLSELSSKSGDYKNAFEYHRKYSEVKDSLLNEESSRQINEMSARFESEKKEKKIILLEKDKEKQEAENSRQRLFLLLVVAIAISAGLIAVIIFRSLKLTRKQKKIIELQKAKVEMQKRIIEEKNTDITDSINYAKGIQQAMLPEKTKIFDTLPLSFIFFKPKDIVSGDFYFFHNSLAGAAEKLVFIAAADCTGHGVPGALMSMIGSEKLDEAVSESADTSDILRRLNIGIKTSLKQSGKDGATRDGMDIALCAINKISRTIKYSGANRPLWVIRKGQSTIEEIAATKKAIGGFTEDNQHFDTHEINLSEGDTFYIFSDGYADCFSGKTGKKLMTKKFKEILLRIQSMGMDEQGRYLEGFIEEWKTGTEQVDDILVIGVRMT